MNDFSEYLRDGTLILSRPTKMPEVLDMLIVGGGPAGTGAAFRAKELGLSALVIDYDDLMKQIRDYPKSKKILPDYGSGDKMKFPKTGELIGQLRFEPIDKDDFCERWKGYYREHNVPAKIGLELVSLERQSEEVWKAVLYNANTRGEEFLLAKHVVLAMGNGAPRAFDIPGNTKDIAYRLSDAEFYIGAPVLVIGSGTSAAEAVISVSNAKVDKKDPNAVYWSYRGNNLPKVSKALADEYFTAFVENGNIRTCPNSEAAAVVATDDRKEYLSIRIDRRIIAGRPNETAHLEFYKEYCIACTGQEIPESFLKKLDIKVIKVGEGEKKQNRIVVTPLLESQQPNVYLIGSMLGNVYFETDDFDDPATFREKNFGGNIKASITDGVFITEVIKQKLDGRVDIGVNLEFYPADGAPKDESSGLLPIPGVSAETMSAPPAMESPRAYLVSILPDDTEGERFPLKSAGFTSIGRKDCDISFPNDTTLSDQHASITTSPEGYFLRDDGSRYGIFLKLRPMQPKELAAGDVVQLGRQFLVVSSENGKHFLLHYDANGKFTNRYQLQEGAIELGKIASIVLDANDATLSRRHLSATLQAGKISIQDLDSRNGTYLKVRNLVQLEAGDQFYAGQRIFKFELKQEASRYSVIYKTPLSGYATVAKTQGPSPGPVQRPPEPPPKTPKAPEPPPPRIQPAPQPPPPAPSPSQGPKLEGMVVRFKNTGQICSYTRGKSICEIAEKNGVPIKADCHEGTCGTDPIRIISGGENMNDPGDAEEATLADKYKLKAGEYRLACVAKPRGPVEVEILPSKN